MKHPDAPLFVGYLQVALDRFKQVSNKCTAMSLLQLAASDVAAHQSGEADMKDVFTEVINRYPQKYENGIA